MSVATRVAAQQQAGTIEIYRDGDEWGWQAVSKDGEIIPGDTHSRKIHAKQAARKLYPRWPLTSRQRTQAPKPKTKKKT